jgi:hypothetical protein
MVNNIEALSFELWSWSAEFLRGLYAERGMEGLGAYYALFVGDYLTTPLGIHRDPESVFHFPVTGSKRIRIFGSDYMDAHPFLGGSTDYADHLEQTILLESGPRGLLYWPSSAWHVGEGDGEFSASLALSILCVSSTDPAFLLYLRSLLIDDDKAKSPHRRDPDPLTDYLQAASKVPPSMESVCRSVRDQFSEDSVARMWLRLLSGAGFFNPPMTAPRQSLAPTDRLRLAEGAIIVWRARDGGGAFVAANGHVFDHSSTARVRHIVERLLSRKPITAQELAAPDGGSSDQAGTMGDTIQILEQLLSARALLKL